MISLSKAFLAVLFATGAIASNPRSLRRQTTGGVEAPKENVEIARRFIIELSPDADIASVVSAINDIRGTTVSKTFDSSLFRGVAVEAFQDNVDSLQALDYVAQAWPARKLSVGPINPGNENQRAANDTDFYEYNIHYMTDVNRAHSQEIYGKGAKVAVIDTGIDYTHDALGGGFGPGFKVIGGYDFVGDGTWPMSGQVKQPDEDPKDLQGHGTHVAGIVAGKTGKFVGVAPEAELLAYKVFSSIDGTDEDVIIEAMIRAFDDGADIATISIGGLDGFIDGAWALVVDRMVNQGVFVSISAGNDGSAGAFAASSGSSSLSAVAVASVDASTIAVPTFQGLFSTGKETPSNGTIINGTSTTRDVPLLTSYEFNPEQLNGWPIVPLTLEQTENDACEPIDMTANLTETIVLVRRGGCTFEQKQFNLENVGVTTVIYYTNDLPLSIPFLGFAQSSIAGMISAQDGRAVIEHINSTGRVTVNFSKTDFTAIDNYYTPGQPSLFTSVGPTNDLNIKADVAAPGGSILSTFPNQQYASLSGTSMACPYIAGVAALYVGKFGGRSVQSPQWAKQLAMRIISSGKSLDWADGTGQTYPFRASVAQVGTGLVNATKVLEYDTQLSFARFATNDTRYGSRYHQVDVTNQGSASVTYTFSQEAFGGLSTIQTDNTAFGAPRIAWGEELLASPMELAPEVRLHDSFTLQPGQTSTAKFTIYPFTAADPSKLPIYSGKIVITGSNGEVLAVPYLGMAAQLRQDLNIMFQTPLGFPTIQSGPDDTPIAQKANFTFNLNTTAEDFPRIYNRLSFATRELRWDIFEASYHEFEWSYPPRVGSNKYVGAATSWSGSGSVLSFDPAVHEQSDVIAFPRLNVARDPVGVRGSDFWWLGKLANGTEIPSGTYKMRFAALKPYGDRRASDDWDVIETPEFTVKRL